MGAVGIGPTPSGPSFSSFNLLSPPSGASTSRPYILTSAGVGLPKSIILCGAGGGP